MNAPIYKVGFQACQNIKLETQPLSNISKSIRSPKRLIHAGKVSKLIEYAQN